MYAEHLGPVPSSRVNSPVS